MHGHLGGSNITEQIQREIMSRGSVAASMIVYNVFEKIIYLFDIFIFYAGLLLLFFGHLCADEHEF